MFEPKPMLGMMMPVPLNLRRTRESIPLGRLQLSCSTHARASPVSSASRGTSSGCVHGWGGASPQGHGPRAAPSASSPSACCTLTAIFRSLWCRLKRLVRFFTHFTFTRGVTILGNLQAGAQGRGAWASAGMPAAQRMAGARPGRTSYARIHTWEKDRALRLPRSWRTNYCSPGSCACLGPCLAHAKF